MKKTLMLFASLALAMAFSTAHAVEATGPLLTATTYEVSQPALETAVEQHVAVAALVNEAVTDAYVSAPATVRWTARESVSQPAQASHISVKAYSPGPNERPERENYERHLT